MEENCHQAFAGPSISHRDCQKPGDLDSLTWILGSGAGWLGSTGLLLCSSQSDSTVTLDMTLPPPHTFSQEPARPSPSWCRGPGWRAAYKGALRSPLLLLQAELGKPGIKQLWRPCRETDTDGQFCGLKRKNPGLREIHTKAWTWTMRKA